MTSHRTLAVRLLLPALLAGGACAGIASAQVTSEFTNSGQSLGDSFSISVTLGDLDGDGDLDAMVANTSGQPNTVWTNDGNGTFTNSGQALGNSKSKSVALGDLDGDGDLDAMVGNFDQPNTVWVNDQLGGTLFLIQQVIGQIRNENAQMSSQITQLQSENTQMQSDIEQLQDIVAVCCAQGNCPADLNGDGEVNGEDLAAVLAAWGLPCDE